MSHITATPVSRLQSALSLAQQAARRSHFAAASRVLDYHTAALERKVARLLGSDSHVVEFDSARPSHGKSDAASTA